LSIFSQNLARRNWLICVPKEHGSNSVTQPLQQHASVTENKQINSQSEETVYNENETKSK